jgi:Pyruvate/2-oxoacid:ferredoxin oxidoreductase gamma subunit
MEPLESLRYMDFLAPDGILITAEEPFVNIPDYPDVAALYAAIAAFPKNSRVPALDLAKKAGSAKATNMVLVGAASRHLPLKAESMENAIRERFASKGEAVIQVNLDAFRAARGLS